MTAIEMSPVNTKTSISPPPKVGSLQQREITDLREQIEMSDKQSERRTKILIAAMVIVVLATAALIIAGFICTSSPMLIAATVGLGIIGLGGTSIYVCICDNSEADVWHAQEAVKVCHAREAVENSGYLTFLEAKGLSIGEHTLIKTFDLYRRQKYITQKLEDSIGELAEVHAQIEALQGKNGTFELKIAITLIATINLNEG